jgi:hypothetical protein
VKLRITTFTVELVTEVKVKKSPAVLDGCLADKMLTVVYISLVVVYS